MATTVTGTLEALMESWPLQLTLAADDGRRVHVTLRDDTRLSGRAGAAVDPGQLRLGARLQVDGDELAHGGVAARRLQVLA